jgi:ADP-ribose pyrophosphatase
MDESDSVKQLAKELAKKYIDAQMVTILPILNGDTIVINKQYRKSSGQWLYELPAGKIDGNEDPEVAARRELEEETGFKAKRLKLLFTSYLVSGLNSKKSYFYVANDLEEGQPHREEDEQIETLKISITKVLEMIKKGEIADSKAISCILYYKHFL